MQYIYKSTLCHIQEDGNIIFYYLERHTVSGYFEECVEDTALT